MYGSGLHVWLRDGFSWRTLRNNFVSQIVYLQYILSGGIFHNWLFAFHLTLVLTVIRWPPLSPVYQATSQMEDFKMRRRRRRRRRRSGWTLLMLLAPASIVPRTPDQDTNTTSCSVSSSGESNINTKNKLLCYTTRESLLSFLTSHMSITWLAKSQNKGYQAFPTFTVSMFSFCCGGTLEQDRITTWCFSSWVGNSEAGWPDKMYDYIDTVGNIDRSAFFSQWAMVHWWFIHLSGFLSGGRGSFASPPPLVLACPPWICWENVNQALMT